MDLNNTITQYFPILAIFTPIVLFYQQSKNIFLKIFRIFWKQRILSGDFAIEFYRELYKQAIIINFDDYDLSYQHLFSINNQQFLPFLFKEYKFEIFLYKKFIPIFLFGSDNQSLKVQYLKFTFNFEKFLKEITHKLHSKIIVNNKEQQENEDRFHITEIRGKNLKAKLIEQSDSKSSSTDAKPNTNTNCNFTISSYNVFQSNINRIIGFPNNNLLWYWPSSTPKKKYQFTSQGLHVLNQVKKWLLAEKWYQERNIPHKRGCVLYGPSGSGKSALILEVARTLKIPIFIFDVSEMTNEEFSRSLDDLTSYPAIILFEDFDCQFNKREFLHKTNQYQNLTFDCFINKLSGVKSINSKFIFFTTNHIENIDDALLRDGRIDEKIELKSLNIEEKKNMAKIILENSDLINKVMEDAEKDTTAEFENKCIRLALDNFWKE